MEIAVFYTTIAVRVSMAQGLVRDNPDKTPRSK
jgi:hypothetical protein